MPRSVRCCCGPMPDSSSSCGELIAPPHRITSRAARTVRSSAVLTERHAGGAAAIQRDALGQRIGDDAQIAALHRRAQIADRGGAAPAVARGELVVADPFLRGAVEVVIARIAEIERALDEGLADRVVVRHVGHAERSAGAVQIALAAGLMFGAAEIRQHVVERPAGVAELSPLVEVLRLAADIDQAVDRRRPAEHLAARPEHAAAVQVGFRLGLVAPVDARVGDRLAVAQRNVDPEMPVVSAGFQQHDARCGVFGQSRGHDAAGRARADDDEVGVDGFLLRGHWRFPV